MKKYMVAVAAFACIPGAAVAQDFDGFRAEARLGWETPTVSDDGDVYKIESDISYGAEIGYDFKASEKVVVGPYATYEFSNVNLCDGTDCISEDGTFAAGLRGGLAVSGSALIYAKLGYSKIKISASSAGLTGSDSDDGIGGAIGANFAFGKNVYGLVEANYADYGSFYGVNLQRRHVAAGIGVRF